MAQQKTIADVTNSALLIDIFASKHLIPMRTIKRMSPYQRKRVRQIASGEIPGMGQGERIKAMRLLSFLGSHHDCGRLGKIVKSKKEDSVIRAAAATYLGNFAPQTAEPELINQLKAGDDLIISKVAKSLGNIGGPTAYSALARIKAKPGSYLEKQVTFAKALIAYRLDLDDDPMPFVKGISRRPDTKDKAHTLAIKRAQARSIQTALKKLEGGLYGMAPATRVGFAVNAGKALWMMFVNRHSEIQGISQSMHNRKLILGVMARWIEETKTYDAQYAILTKPLGSKGAQIMVIRSDGTVMYSGKATAKGESLSFAVTDTKRPGTSKTKVSGEFTQKGIDIQTGITLYRREGKRNPTPLNMKDLEARFERMKKVGRQGSS